MKPLPLLFGSLPLLLGAAFAAEPPAVGAAPPGPDNPVLTSDAGASPQKAAPTAKPRAVSAATAARLAAVAPPYSPPAARPNPTAPEEQEDKPRNGIIRLPRYIVREPKVPALSDIQVLTPKGKVDLAYKAFPGLRFGSFWIFRNDAQAQAMLDDELMVERGRRVADLLTLLPTDGTGTDSAPDGKTRRLIQDALTPRSSWTTMTTDTSPGR